MSVLIWVMMAIAVWHFTIWVPDRFYGGIVGAFVAAILGALVVGFAVAGLTIPSRAHTHLDQAIIAIPGALAALAVSYVYGSHAEAQKQRARAQAAARRSR